MSHSASSGIVSLVGAGPGDPGLITVRGRRLLEQAQVVVYDYLANPALLSYCPQAELIYVGKKGASHTRTQEQINQLLIDLGRSGRRIVRLKGGDPFIFGRGAEECQVLHEAGVRFEVVPGITASIGGACYAGIPVTHRDFNSSVTLITGHEKEEEYKSPESLMREPAAGSSDIDWNAVAKLPCIAFYMGVKSLGRISQKLIAGGMKPDTAAATIEWGTWPQQQTVVGTISTLPQLVESAGISAPAMTIVGQVVTLRPALNWFETRPLFGKTIVVTRTRQQASELSAALEELGANVIEAPTIQLTPPADWHEVDEALAQAGSFDWLIFTSANGVRMARKRLDEIGQDVRIFGKVKVAAIGDATAAAIRQELSLRVDLCPQRFVAEALSDELIQSGQASKKKFLLLRADIARPILRQRLEAAGAAQVRDVAIYQTEPAADLPAILREAIANRSVNWITFTSSSTANNFVKLLGADYLKQLTGVKIASIGPITTSTLHELGIKPTVQAETFNIPGLVDAIAAGG